jgi:hypothetical protein
MMMRRKMRKRRGIMKIIIIIHLNYCLIIKVKEAF